MASVKDVDQAASFRVEHFPEDLALHLVTDGTLAQERIQMMLKILNVALPSEVAAEVVFSGDFRASARERIPTPAWYTTDRGTNLVAGRTLPLGSGGFALIFDGWLLINDSDNSGDRLASRTLDLLHTAAHEAQHVHLGVTGTDAESFQDMTATDAVTHQFRKVTALMIDEYRCERAANALLPDTGYDPPRLQNDLTQFRAELNSAHAICDTDRYSAFVGTMTAASEMWKILGYFAAAQPAPTHDTVLSPEPVPDGWSEYVADVWEPLALALKAVPPANVLTTAEHLAYVNGLLCALLHTWLGRSGVEYSFENGNESCYWTRESY